MAAQTPKYLLDTDHFLGGVIHRKGVVIEYDGVPSRNMKAQNAAAKKAIEDRFGQKENAAPDKS